MAETTETLYHVVTIAPHYAGFGMWQASPADSDLYDKSTYLEQSASPTTTIYELGDDELPEGVADIRGSIYDEPAIVFAIVDDETGEVVSYEGLAIA